MNSADQSRAYPLVQLSDEEIVRANNAALDTRALAQERIRRFARPDERREVGLRINPESAHVFFTYAQVIDPYGDIRPGDFQGS